MSFQPGETIFADGGKIYRMENGFNQAVGISARDYLPANAELRR